MSEPSARVPPPPHWNISPQRQDVAAGESLPAWWTALRPHQWTKNALLLLPPLAAHIPWDASAAVRLALGLGGFSCTASAVYLINDLVDRTADRQHPVKRTRPVAAGTLGVRAALWLIAALLAAATALGGTLAVEFQVAMATYFGVALLYSGLLKRKPIIDVLTLAFLYALRVVAGAALFTVALSRWFLAFSVFFFLSLALVKRVVELQRPDVDSRDKLPGRAYRAGDLHLLSSFGIAATVASGLVYCLYITSDDIETLYTRPDLLWPGLLILLYWQARVWLLAERGAMNEDPVVFALRDRTSRFAVLGFLGLLVLAAR
jgi:4-hydroxybenzoate polyprenyltransferase